MSHTRLMTPEGCRGAMNTKSDGRALSELYEIYPDSKVHGANLGPHEPCCLGRLLMNNSLFGYCLWIYNIYKVFNIMMTSSNGKNFHFTAFCEGKHWWPVAAPQKGQRCGTFMFFFICAWTNGLANNQEAGDWRQHDAHNKVTLM